MKKRNIRSVLVVLAMSMTLFAGCGGSDEEDGRGDVITEEPSGEEVIVEEAETTDDASAFYGIWEYESGDGIISIYDDGTAEWLTDDGDTYSYTYTVEDGVLYLTDSDLCYMVNGEGSLIDNDNDVLYPYGSDVVSEEPAVNAEDFFGYWKYTDEEYWLYFSGEGTYETYNEEGSHQSGEYRIEDDGTLHVNEQDWYFTLTGDGTMVDNFGDEMVVSEAPDYLAYADAINDSYLANIDVEMYTLDQGDVILPYGAYSFEYGTDGAGYQTSSLAVSVNLEDETELDNGYVQRTISVYMGILEDGVPDYANGISDGCSAFFYDAYTGTLLPDNTYFEGGSGAGSYYFEFETPMGWVDLYMQQSANDRDDVEGYVHLNQVILTIVAPEWYDGLILAVPEQPDTFEERVEYSEFFGSLDYLMSADNQPFDVEDALNCAILQ